jgi:SAM-dependent methyltransferase
VTPLSHQRVRAIYDRIGAKQDTQIFYENPAVRMLLRQGDFEHARRVFEFGCGTGRVAAEVLALAPGASYRGLDLSPRMVALARERLERFGPAAEVALSEGEPPADPPASCDRFLSTYVLDVLPEEEIRAVIAAAHRMLEPGGRLCVCSLTHGITPASRFVVGIWERVHARHPAWVGGCRPLEPAGFLAEGAWRVRFNRKISAWGVPSDVLVAERVAG